MGGIRSHQLSADQPFLDTLPHHFFKQPSKDFPERRFSPEQLENCAVIQHTVKQIQPQVLSQSNVCLYTLLNLPLRGDAIQIPHRQILHHDHRIVGRLLYRWLYSFAVASYTKDRSITLSNFRRKCSSGTMVSIVTVCSFSCISLTLLSYTTFSPRQLFVNRAKSYVGVSFFRVNERPGPLPAFCMNIPCIIE